MKKRFSNTNSKFCLMFGIISIDALSGFFNLFDLKSFVSFYNIPFFKSEFFTILRTVIFFGMAITGLVCGFLAILFSQIAKDMEPKNNLEKAGSIMGIIGLTFNGSLLFLMLYVSIYLESLFLFE